MNTDKTKKIVKEKSQIGTALRPKDIKVKIPKIPKIKSERDLLNTGSYENVLWVLLSFLIINTIAISAIATVASFLMGWSWVLVGIIGACGVLDVAISIPLTYRLFKTLIKLIRVKAEGGKID